MCYIHCCPYCDAGYNTSNLLPIKTHTFKRFYCKSLLLEQRHLTELVCQKRGFAGLWEVPNSINVKMCPCDTTGSFHKRKSLNTTTDFFSIAVWLCHTAKAKVWSKSSLNSTEIRVVINTCISSRRAIHAAQNYMVHPRTLWFCIWAVDSD